VACYIISYDLRRDKDYESLYKAIKSYDTWAHILESTWAIVTEKTATEIREYLRKFTDSDDGLFVVKSGSEAAWVNVICKNQWLKDNL
jgi:hypothetical protein